MLGKNSSADELSLVFAVDNVDVGGASAPRQDIAPTPAYFNQSHNMNHINESDEWKKCLAAAWLVGCSGRWSGMAYIWADKVIFMLTPPVSTL
ncbi:hypothetical protein NLJ89_g2323 [Agrocybe chaxingu]|uniref:Uncharacterized protein n=1 Tax=Agrocybe chaxingu TaxID=84603 RepID=A0A9W8MYR7_9AGAR|nr:hypothetical protein NLJ89_g2323 [Agrocybe chaxingu]